MPAFARPKALLSSLVAAAVLGLVSLGGVVLGRVRLTAPAPAPAAAAPAARSQSAGELYALARTLDLSLVRWHDLHSVDRRPLPSPVVSSDAVFQKALSVAREFNVLHPGVFGQPPIDPERLAEFEDGWDEVPPAAGEIHDVLSLLHEELRAQDVLVQAPAEEAERSFAEVYQVLRQISAHLAELERRRSAVEGSRSERVLEVMFLEVEPLLQRACDERGIDVQAFRWPPQSRAGVSPAQLLRGLRELHAGLAALYRQPHDAAEHAAEVTTAELHDLVLVMAGDFKVWAGGPRELSRFQRGRQEEWRQGRERVTLGDVAALLEHQLRLVRLLHDRS